MAKAGRTKDYARGQRIEAILWEKLPKPTALQKDLLDITTEHLFGKIWARPGLKLRDRSLITVAALTVLGRERQLRSHLRAARRLGITLKELNEMMIHLAHYGGWPAGFTGLIIAEEVFQEPAAEESGRASSPNWTTVRC